MKTLIYPLIFATFLLKNSLEAQSTVNNNFTYNLSQLTYLGFSDWTGFFNPQAVPSFTVHSNDTINTTVNFLPGQSLEFTNNPSVSQILHLTFLTYSNQANAGNITATTQFTLFTTTGNITINPSGLYGTHSGDIEQGAANFGLLTSSDIQFTGFSMISTVNQLGTGSSLTLNYAEMDIQSGFPTISPTPEPSTLALASLGAASLLAFRRRK